MKKGLLMLLVALSFCTDSAFSQKREFIRYYQKNKAALLSRSDFWSNDKKSLTTYLAADNMVKQIWGKGEYNILSKDTVYVFDTTFILNRIDVTGDTIPDQFALILPGQQDSQDFGFMYDLNGDGKYDYYIYYGGFMQSHDGYFYYYFSHLMDTDFDQKIDQAVFSNVVQSKDVFPDPHKLLWIRDTNNDSKVNELKFIDHEQQTIKKVEMESEVWKYRTAGEINTVSPEDDFFGIWTSMLNLIQPK